MVERDMLSDPSDPAAFIERYVKLHRSHDIDGFLALHTEDADFFRPGQKTNPLHGAALRDLFEWDMACEAQLEMHGVSTNGDALVIETVIERSKWLRGLGLSELRYDSGTRMVLRDGLIAQTYPAAFSAESKSKLNPEFERLVQWLSANRPHDLERLLPNGQLKQDRASAMLWLDVMGQWARQRWGPEAPGF